MIELKSLIMGHKKKLLCMSAVHEVVSIFVIKGGNVNSVGLPKNGHNIFSVWYEDSVGANKVAVIPNKEWSDFSDVEKIKIEKEIETLVNVTA